MADTDHDLERRLADLEAENRRLRAELGDTGGVGPAAPPARPGRVRTILAAVLIVLGLLAAPAAIVSGWAKHELTDTERFVSTFAPLAQNPAVQAYVTDQVVDAIDTQLNVTGLTGDLFDGLRGLNLPPRTTNALGRLEAPMAAALQNLIRTTVERFVTSDAFAGAWTQTLRISHTRMVATLEGDPDTGISIRGRELALELGPIITAVKNRLIEQGLALAAQIPVVNRTIVVATSPAFATIQVVYRVATVAGSWLPWAAAGLLAGGVLVARRRVVALMWMSLGLAVTMATLALGFGMGHIFFLSAVTPDLVPADAATVLYEAVVTQMRATTVATGVAAAAVALVAWLATPLATPTRLRRAISDNLDALRDWAQDRGVSTGAFGGWLHRQRVLARTVIAVLAVGYLYSARPLTPSVIVWTLVWALLGLLVTELLRRPDPTPEQL